MGRVPATHHALRSRPLSYDSAMKNGDNGGAGGRICGEWQQPIPPITMVSSEPMHRGDSKYFRNIVANTNATVAAAAADKTKLLSSHNDLNVQINRTAPIKSVKLLNNLNALKLK